MINCGPIINLIKETNSKFVVYDNTNSDKSIIFSPNIYEFMNTSLDVKLTMLDIIKYIIEYININQLQNIENTNNIIPDIKLKNLLGITETEKLTNYNILKYINRELVIKL